MAEDKSKAALNKAKDFEKRADTYNASQIQVLGGLEAVRKRPGMYIGSTSSQGLHHLVWEIIDKRWDNKLKTPLHLAGYYLNLYYYYPNKLEIELDGTFRGSSILYHKDGSRG